MMENIRMYAQGDSEDAAKAAENAPAQEVELEDEEEESILTTEVIEAVIISEPAPAAPAKKPAAKKPDRRY